MSKKILIDLDTLDVVIDALNIGYLTAKGDAFQKAYYARQRLLKEMQETQQKSFSILKWHPMSEKPEKNKRFLVRYKDGLVFPPAVSSFEKLEDCGVVAWAYTQEQTA